MGVLRRILNEPYVPLVNIPKKLCFILIFDSFLCFKILGLNEHKWNYFFVKRFTMTGDSSHETGYRGRGTSYRDVRQGTEDGGQVTEM